MNFFKRLKNTIIITTILILTSNINIYAHGGNITGWKKKDSIDIIKYDDKYYGYHKEDKVKHYHQVEWDEEKQRWNILNPAVYYDEKFNIINNYENVEKQKIEVEYFESVDGDTAKFKLDGKIVTVRFLGIDTPETVHTQKEEQPYGKKASNYTKEKLKNAKKIELEYDSNASEKDKYDRILAWIWVDDNLLQEKLVTSGLAKTYMLQTNYKYASKLQLAETEAKNNKVNIWSDIETNNLSSNVSETNTITNNKQEEKEASLEVISIISATILLSLIKTLKKNKK